MMTSLIFGSRRPLPAEHRANFIHLYFDIAWFGVLNGSAISFMAIFAARQGADAFQLGLLSATPAVVNLVFTLPTGQWLQKRPIAAAVFWTSVCHRLFYLLWIFLPFLFTARQQVWMLIGLVLLMSIPGTALAVGFNALFADVVPPVWRSHVVGVRNALLSIVFIVTSLLCGWLLETLPFPLGYQVVFAIGFLGAVMSSLHLWFIRLSAGRPVVSRVGRGLGELAQPGAARTWGDGLRAGGLRFLTRFKKRPLLIPGVLSGRFGVIIGLLFFFHLAQYLAIPLFPLYWVNHLRLTDAEISLGNAVFYMVVLLGSTQLARITNRSSHKQVMAAGVTIMCLYPLLTAVTQNLTLFLITSAIGGVSWSMVSGAISNYILERIPDDERPSHLAWYNLALNAAILFASLGGPALAGQTGLVAALVIIGIGRFTAALALWRWG